MTTRQNRITKFLLIIILFSQSAIAQFDFPAQNSSEKIDGYFVSDTISIYCRHSQNECSGRIKIDGKSFPFQGTVTASGLQGRFFDANRYFDFAATLKNDMLNFRCGGESDSLTRTEPRFDGRWFGQNAQLDLQERQRGQYVGTWSLNSRSGQLQATADGDLLKGQMTDPSGRPVPFVAEHHGDRVVLANGPSPQMEFRPERSAQLAARMRQDIAQHFFIRPQWHDIGQFFEGRCAVKDGQGRWGYVDAYGKLVVPCQYSKAGQFNNGLAAVYQQDKIGIIDAMGTMRMPIGSKEAQTRGDSDLLYGSNPPQAVAQQESDAHDGEFWTEYKKTPTGKSLSTKSVFGNLAIGESFYENMAVVRIYGGTKRYIANEYEARPSARNPAPTWEHTYNFRLDKSTELQNALIDGNGEILFTTAHYRFLSNRVTNGLIPVQQRSGSSLKGMLGTDGNVVIPCKWEDVKFHSEGLAPAKANGKWGFIDDLGEIIVPCVFEDVQHFERGHAWVKHGGLWGCIRNPLPRPADINELVAEEMRFTAMRRQELHEEYAAAEARRIAQQKADAATLNQRLQLQIPDAIQEPEIALDGYCPVTLATDVKWAKGKFLYKSTWRGRKYAFATFGNKRTFDADPEKYAVFLNGYDPVKLFDEGRWVAGAIKHTLVIGGHSILFADEASKQQLRADSDRYVTACEQIMAQQQQHFDLPADSTAKRKWPISFAGFRKEK